MMCQRIGRSPTGTIGLGRNSVSSRKRVPRPPQKITTFIYLFFAGGQNMRKSVITQRFTAMDLDRCSVMNQTNNNVPNANPDTTGIVCNNFAGDLPTHSSVIQ